ncbi:MAG: DMT family transporter [Candidatus Bathyarchaeota archaeon]|nr:MAG: DMT family transporter [Candidatus Bathyarchaeota archaeon]
MIVEFLSLIAAFCYTLSGLLAVFGMKNSNPTTATLISMTANVLILWPITFLYSAIVFDNSALLLYALSAAFAPVTGRLLNYAGMERVGVSTSTSILGLQPIMVAILASVFFSERLPLVIYLAIVITVIGVVIIGRSHSSPSDNKPFRLWELILPFSATFCYSSSNIVRKEGLKIQNLPLLAASATCSFSLLYLGATLLVTNKRKEIVTTRSSTTLFALSGLVNSLAWITSFQALNIGEASIVSTVLGIQPLIAIVLSYVFLKKTEIITIQKAIGALLIVLGVFAITILQ